MNTGSPDSPSVGDVRRYLNNFLTDKRVISIPKWLRYLLVRGIISPFRAPRSAKKYQQIWDEKGSPLHYFTQELADKVERLSVEPVFVAMRYQKGSTERALALAEAKGVEELVVVPLFPHYAMSSFESAVAHVAEVHAESGSGMQLTCVAPYFDEPLYMEALAEQVAESVAPGWYLLLSYHGIPVAQTKPYLGVTMQDYEYQCEKTSHLLMSHPKVAALDVAWESSYQSRFGNNKWLGPETERRMKELAEMGVRKLAVLSPSFVCDGLETLEELGIRGRDAYMGAGGGELRLIACPNGSEWMARTILKIAEPERVTTAELWTGPQRK